MDELKQLVAFGLNIVELVSHFSEGGSIWTAIGKLIDLGKNIGGAIKNAGVALQEYAAMTDEQALDLENFVVAEFDIPNDSVEAVIESALKVIIELHGLAKFLIKPKP